MTENHSSVIVQDLVKRFGGFVAVDHISLETRKGEIFGFLGPNGAGKSTTIRMLCGLLTPTSGTGHVAGFDIARAIAPRELVMRAEGTAILLDEARYGDSDGIDDLYQDRPSGPDLRRQ